MSHSDASVDLLTTVGAQMTWDNSLPRDGTSDYFKKNCKHDLTEIN